MFTQCFEEVRILSRNFGRVNKALPLSLVDCWFVMRCSRLIRTFGQMGRDNLKPDKKEE
jgi:hypothetical protein